MADFAPVGDGHFPSLRGAIHRQPEQLHDRRVGRKRAAGLGDLAKLAVEGLDRIGRVHGPSQFSREGKERRDT